VNGPTLTITLSGGPHLHEFASFSLKAVRAFDPSKPGSRCLRGPFLRVDGERVPPLNTPTPYVVPPNAAALYVYGKSAAGAAHDIHAPLVPAPGEQVVLPLTVATEEKRRDVARLAALLQDAEFVFARTMLDNPHHYTRRADWADAEAFEFAVRGVRLYGHRAPYIRPGEAKVAYQETVFHSASHFYWSGYLPVDATHWINRKGLQAPVEARVFDQVLRVEDARRLDVPALSDGFAGLDTMITRDRHFQTGVHLFGWPAPRDLRPRLVRRRRRA
jgi:hypothetical protein